MQALERLFLTTQPIVFKRYLKNDRKKIHRIGWFCP
jgi:hypothetical protein